MASGNDLKATNEAYVGFIDMVKWSTISVAIIAIGLISAHE
jgi:hypothetical protein